MKSVTVPLQGADLNALLDQARVEDILVQTADGSEFLLSMVDEFDQELARTRQNGKLMELLDIRAQSNGVKSLASVKEELGLG